MCVCKAVNLQFYFIYLCNFSGAEALRVEFDRQCSTERKHDPLTIMDGSGKVICTRSGREWSDWSTEVRIAGTVFIRSFLLKLN